MDRCLDPLVLEDLIKISTQEDVLTSLCAVLQTGLPRRFPRVPWALLTLEYESNKRRNRTLYEAILELASVAQSQGISFTVLKGASWILLDKNEFAAWRRMNDIDLLVSAEHFDKLPKLLSSLGYHPEKRPQRLFGTRSYRGHFHLVPYRRENAEFTIEVHRHLGWRASVLSPETIFSEQLHLEPNLAVPAPWCAAMHAILHWQIQHGSFKFGMAAGVSDLKCALDVARYLRRRDVDWTMVTKCASSAGVYDELQAGITFATELFRTSIPCGLVVSSTGRSKLDRYIEFREFPGRNWVARRRARIMSVWAGERAMYKLRLRNWSPSYLTLAKWCLRLMCLPFLGYLYGGLVMATLRSKISLSAPRYLGRA
jgi:hypothetical protein